MKKSGILTLATLALTIVGSILANKQQELEIAEAVDARLALETKNDETETED